MRQKQILVSMLVGVALVVFGGIGYLLAIEDVAFFAAMKSFFLALLGFGGILIAFFVVSTALLWLLELLGKLFNKG